MAKFAQIKNGIVTQVILCDIEGTEGEAYCAAFMADGLVYKQTSFNGSIRKNFAGIGYSYDEVRDAFIAPKPDDDFTFDEDTCQWVPPPKKDGEE